MSHPEPEALPLVDLVIVIDTSLSLKDEAQGLSQAAEAAIETSRSHCPSDLRVVWLGVEGTWRNTHFNQSIRRYLTETCGVDEASLRGRKRGTLPGGGAQEDGGRAMEDIANHFDWRTGAKRAMFYLSDEALDGGGNSVDDEDIEAANVAIDVAQRAEMTIHTYFGSTRSRQKAAMEAECARVSEATGGRAFTSQDSIEGFSELLEQIICTTQQQALEAQAGPVPSQSETEPAAKPKTAPPSALTAAGGTTGGQAPAPGQSERYHEAICLLKNYVIAAMGIGLMPIPVIDFVAITALQMRMIQHFSELYGVPFNDNLGHSFLVSVSGGFVSSTSPRWAASLFKLVPGVGLFYGLVAMSSVSGASTYAVGRAFINRFEQGHTLSTLRNADLKQDVQRFQAEGQTVVAQLNRQSP